MSKTTTAETTEAPSMVALEVRLSKSEAEMLRYSLNRLRGLVESGVMSTPFEAEEVGLMIGKVMNRLGEAFPG